jgi:hypothetical protein
MCICSVDWNAWHDSDTVVHVQVAWVQVSQAEAYMLLYTLVV